MNPRLALLVAIVAASVTQSVMAQVLPPHHELVFTEDSSGLAVTYDGSSITATPTGPQSWSVQFPSNLSFVTTSPWQWFETEALFTVNVVTFGSPGNKTQVSSDASFGVGFITHDEDVQFPVGVDTSNNEPIAATFDDDGEPVPETGSTFGLLLLALVALVSASRCRQLRLA